MFGIKKDVTLDWQPPAAVVVASPTGEMVLGASGGSLGARFFGIAFFATLWNGFIYLVLRDVTGGGLVSPAMIFFVPFILIGLGLLWATLVAFAAFFNPRPVITCARPTLRVGERTTISCELRGGFLRAQKMTITLEGREEATYRQGTDTTTVKQIFYAQTLCETTSDAARVEAKIPDGTMHSFESPNNKIVWMIGLQAPVSMVSSINEEWKLIVEPGT